MPEIMSAEQCADKISKRFYNGTINSTNLKGFIYSRDSAMLEKYKDSIRNVIDFTTQPGSIYNHSYVDGLTYAMELLDSTFAEIDGGK